MHVQFPVAARKAVTQWFLPIQDGQPVALKEFHQQGSLIQEVTLCVPEEHYGSQWKGSFHVHSVLCRTILV